jgi:hypothetical protein
MVPTGGAAVAFLGGEEGASTVPTGGATYAGGEEGAGPLPRFRPRPTSRDLRDRPCTMCHSLGRAPLRVGSFRPGAPAVCLARHGRGAWRRRWRAAGTIPTLQASLGR